MGVRVKISSGADIYDNTISIIRYVEEQSTVLNSVGLTAQINLVIKHYLLINGVETYASFRYPDFNTNIIANNQKYIYIDGSGKQHYLHQSDLYASDGITVNSPYVLGTNTWGQYDFFVLLRSQSQVFDNIISGQILGSDSIGQFNDYTYLKFS